MSVQGIKDLGIIFITHAPEIKTILCGLTMRKRENVLGLYTRAVGATTIGTVHKRRACRPARINFTIKINVTKCLRAHKIYYI